MGKIVFVRSSSNVYELIIIIVIIMNNISNNNNTTENSKCNRNESKATNSLYGDSPALARYKFTQIVETRQ